MERMEKQLSAVEWLAKNLKDFPHVKHSQLFRDLVQQAKEMEKEQHLKTWTEGLYCETGDKQAFEQYYKETFKLE
jgi:hypothetical protein